MICLKKRMFILRVATAMVAILFCPLTAAIDSFLPPAEDMARDAESARRSGLPLIVLVSFAGCPHCEVVRRSHLLPLLHDAQTAATPKPVIRQVEINGRKRLRDFNGKEITHAEFALRHKVTIAPVVFFFDAKGELLAEALVGSMIPDFYGAYFDSAFSQASLNLKGLQPVH